MTGKTSRRPLLWLSFATVFPGNGQALRAKDGHPKSTPSLCPENITFPTSENFFFFFLVLLCVFKSYKLVSKGRIAASPLPRLDLKTTFRKRSPTASPLFSFKVLLLPDFLVSIFPLLRVQQGWSLSVGFDRVSFTFSSLFK